GVRLPYRVPSRTIEFRTGDVIVLHSDGVYESRNAAGEVYGLERLMQLLVTLTEANAEVMRDAVLRDVEAFRGTQPQEDDVTVVVVRIL
ncbi:MAG: serine/threonine-protein phosphatase, partial [Thermoanaerobaculia bacterium]|nr:serine/threonine-protein phosphatase [Thermoanaerobaculia bacterium]